MSMTTTTYDNYDTYYNKAFFTETTESTTVIGTTTIAPTTTTPYEYEYDDDYDYDSDTGSLFV